MAYAEKCSKAYIAALAEPFCEDASYYRRGALQKTREHALGIQLVQSTLEEVLDISSLWYQAEVAATYLYVYKALLRYYARVRNETENGTYAQQSIINEKQQEDIDALCEHIDQVKREPAQTPCRFDFSVALCIDNYFCDRLIDAPLDVKKALFGTA